MRILLLNYEFPPLGGGAGIACLELVRELSKDATLQIDVVTSSPAEPSTEPLFPNVFVYRVDIGKRGANPQRQSLGEIALYAIKAYRLSRRLARQNAYDGVHAFFGIPCGLAALRLGLPYIVSLRGSDVPFYNPRFRTLDTLFLARLSRRIWSKAKVVVANSEDLRRLALKTAPLQRIEVIENGVRAEDLARPVKKDGGFTLVSTSRLDPRKRIDRIVRAFIAFARGKQDVRLLIAGDGPDRRAIEALAATSSEAGKISFLGALPRQQIGDLYEKSDVFAIVSDNEGMSNSLLEAAACGLAVMSTDTGGARRLGATIVDGSEGSIARNLDRLYSDPRSLAEAKSSSRKAVESMAWSVPASAYARLYLNL